MKEFNLQSAINYMRSKLLPNRELLNLSNMANTPNFNPDIIWKNASKYIFPLMQWFQLFLSLSPRDWRISSFIRQSANHEAGASFDIVPYYTDDEALIANYATAFNRNPYLSVRDQPFKLLTSTHELWLNIPGQIWSIYALIEDDHVHVQVFPKELVTWNGVRTRRYKFYRPRDYLYNREDYDKLWLKVVSRFKRSTDFPGLTPLEVNSNRYRDKQMIAPLKVKPVGLKLSSDNKLLPVFSQGK